MWEANRSERFAGLQLTVKPLIGLARAEGWKIDPDAGLVRQFGTVEVHFELGDEIFPGMAGAIESVAYSFWKRGTRPRRVPMADMPPIVYSEASRAVDLLVSTCAHAYVGEDSREPMTVGEAGIQLMNEPAPPRSGPLHPRLRREIRLRQLATVPLGDMRAMRRQVLEDTFSEQVRAGHVAFDDRSASIGALTVNLNTAKVSRGGEQIDFKLPKVGSKGSKLAALPWVPYDEALLEKLVGTIATLLAA